MLFVAVSSRIRQTYLSFGSLRLLLGVTAVVALAIIWFTAPRAEKTLAELSGTDKALDGQFESYGSLLLPGDSRFLMNRVFATTSKSELDYWLKDEVIFNRFVQRFGVLEKTAKRLKKKGQNRLAGWAYSVSVVGVMVERTDAPKTFGERSVRGKGLEGYFGAQKWERDYAMLDNLDEARRRQRRVNRILVKASAASPEDAQLLASETMESLRSQLVWVSLRSAKNRRRAIENYIQVNQRKIKKTLNRLAHHTQAAPERLSQLRRRLDKTGQRLSDLGLEIAELRQQIATQRSRAAVRWQSRQNPAQEKADQIGRELRAAERVLLEGAPALQALRDRFLGIDRLAARMDRDAAEAAVSELEATLAARLRLREEARAEQARLQKLLPTLTEQRSYQEMDHELNTWETEQLSWEQQLLRARIEERLCRGDGTAIVLQSPQLGRPGRLSHVNFFSTYRKTLVLLPLAPLAGLVSLLAMGWLREWSRIGRKVEYFLDAPVLAELPAPSPLYRRTWDEIKFTGPSVYNKKPEKP